MTEQVTSNTRSSQIIVVSSDYPQITFTDRQPCNPTAVTLDYEDSTVPGTSGAMVNIVVNAGELDECSFPWNEVAPSWLVDLAYRYRPDWYPTTLGKLINRA